MQEMQQKKSLEPVSCPRRVVLWIAGSVVATRVLFYLIYCIQFHDSSFSGFLGAINIWDANWYRLILEINTKHAFRGVLLFCEKMGICREFIGKFAGFFHILLGV